MTTLDERSERSSTDMVRTTSSAMEMPVAEFEGEMIRNMVGALPKLNFGMEVGYRRGTHLKIELEVRIKNLLVTEDSKGDLTRTHMFVLEEAKLIGVYTADELDPGVGGSAAVGADDQEYDHQYDQEDQQEMEMDGRPDGTESDGQEQAREAGF